MLNGCKSQYFDFRLQPYLELTPDEQQMKQSQLLAKEEINMALYAYKRTFNLEQSEFLSMLRFPLFWKQLKRNTLWRNSNTTSKQFYNIFYNKIVTCKITLPRLMKIYQLIKSNKTEPGFYYVNKYKSSYPYEYLGLYILAPYEFSQIYSTLKMTPMYTFKTTSKKQRKSKDKEGITTLKQQSITTLKQQSQESSGKLEKLSTEKSLTKQAVKREYKKSCLLLEEQQQQLLEDLFYDLKYRNKPQNQVDQQINSTNPRCLIIKKLARSEIKNQLKPENNPNLQYLFTEFMQKQMFNASQTNILT